MTEQEKIKTVEILLDQYAKYVNDHYPVFVSGGQIDYEQLSDFKKVNHPRLKSGA